MVTESGKRIDPAHVYIVGLGSNGSSDIYIKDLYVSMDGETKATEEALAVEGIEATSQLSEIYSVSGVRQPELQKGVNIIRSKEGATVKVLSK